MRQTSRTITRYVFFIEFIHKSLDRFIVSQFPLVAYKLNKNFPCDTCQFSKQKLLPYYIELWLASLVRFNGYITFSRI